MTAPAAASDLEAALDAAQERAAAMSSAEREDAAAAIDRARVEAAEFLVDRGSASDARLAAAWLLSRVA